MEDNPVTLLLIVILACWQGPGRLAPATAASRKKVSGTSMKDVAEEGKDREERRGEFFRLKFATLSFLLQHREFLCTHCHRLTN